MYTLYVHIINNLMSTENKLKWRESVEHVLYAG